jgi:SAM-dependent methyltransferase
VDRQQALSFEAAVDAYADGRPTYPSQAVDWLLPPDAHRVLDLGAGTGKLTAQLVTRGLDVVAVEPSPAMLDRLAATLPDGAARVGYAEDIPAADADFDAVLVGQAWHWVDPHRASAEIARVLRPGGRLGLIWNLRDDTEPWVAALDALMPADENQQACTDAPTVGSAFGPLERHDTRWAHSTSREGLLDLVASRSGVITLPETKRTAVLNAVSTLLDEHPDLRDTPTITIPYRTRSWRTRLTA